MRFGLRQTAAKSGKKLTVLRSSYCVGKRQRQGMHAPVRQTTLSTNLPMPGGSGGEDGKSGLVLVLPEWLSSSGLRRVTRRAVPVVGIML